MYKGIIYDFGNTLSNTWSLTFPTVLALYYLVLSILMHPVFANISVAEELISLRWMKTYPVVLTVLTKSVICVKSENGIGSNSSAIVATSH